MDRILPLMTLSKIMYTKPKKGEKLKKNKLKKKNTKKA